MLFLQSDPDNFLKIFTAAIFFLSCSTQQNYWTLLFPINLSLHRLSLFPVFFFCLTVTLSHSAYQLTWATTNQINGSVWEIPRLTFLKNKSRLSGSIWIGIRIGIWRSVRKSVTYLSRFWWFAGNFCQSLLYKTSPGFLPCCHGVLCCISVCVDIFLAYKNQLFLD